MITEKIKVSVPGKVHLLGEHAVVYGKPALLAAIDKRCFITLTPSKNSCIKISSTNVKRTKEYTFEQIGELRDKARKEWEEFNKNADLSILQSITQDEMDFIAIAIGETFDYFQTKISSGFFLQIKSDIPVGTGLGSSAAVAVAVIAAVTVFLDKKIEDHKEQINEIAFLVEQKKHGNPSGGDNATVCFGGLIWFHKETQKLNIIQQLPFSISDDVSKNFMFLDTGRPKESTGEMINLVKQKYKNQEQLVRNIFDDQEKLTRNIVSALKNTDGNEVIRIIKAGESNLEKLGVVSETTKRLIHEIEQSGGAAKISGGGGKTAATGILLVYHRNKKIIQTIAKIYKLEYFNTTLGVEGVRYD